MRLLFIAPYTPLLTKPRPYNFLLHLAKNHEIYLVCFGDFTQEQLANRPDYQILKSHCAYIEHIPIPKPRIALNVLTGMAFSTKPLRVCYYGPTFARERIHQIVRDKKIQAIHVDRSRFAGLAGDIDLPKVLDLTDSITWYIQQCLRKAPLHLKPAYALELTRMRKYEKTVGMAYDQCLITNPYDKEWFRDTDFYDRINVVPNALDRNFFTGDIPATNTAKSLLFYGNLSYHPNVDGIKHFSSKIFPQIQKRVGDVKLHIVGNKPARVIQRLKKNPGIRVTGWVPSLIDYISSVNVVISPLRIGVGFPNKIAESLAIGKAIVSTDIGCRGLPDSDQALLVARNNEEFIEATTRLLEDADFRKQLEKRAWSYARKTLNPDDALASLDAVFAKL